MALTSKQRAYLRGLAHHLNPTVLIGSAGLTEEVLRKVKFELSVHELIKVKVSDAPLDVSEAGPQLAEQTESDLVQTIGHIAVLYKKRKKDPEIRLPKDETAG
jgi:RNA-binding protein